ncbi:hypothetical protein ABMA28_007875 [Loxostege sticticalis]|uniref:Uncharacterized protein n=1 Tax=Loxostege sticticalis TaxID=481309 RepID=A0ABD0SJ26_LOXSC
MADAKEAIRELRSNRGYVKASITRLCGSCTDSDIEAMLLPNLKVKLTKLESLFTEYEGFSKKLFFLSDSSDDEDYSVVEGKYFSVMAKLQDAIEKKNVPAKHDDSYDAESCSRTKLPTIQMSCFQGEYSEYQPFISLFDSLIHRDKHLDSLQKLYYLRSYLKCEPYDLIKNLPLSNESYLKARQLLDDRYNNKYKILNEHIAQLLDLSPLSKSTSANIRSFVSSTKQIIAAIENLNNDIKYWDPIILCILTRKLDTYTARAYQMERDDNMEPKVKDFIEFLEKRALAMENAEPTTSKSSKVVVNVAAQKTSANACLYYSAAISAGGRIAVK